MQNDKCIDISDWQKYTFDRTVCMLRQERKLPHAF